MVQGSGGLPPKGLSVLAQIVINSAELEHDVGRLVVTIACRGESGAVYWLTADDSLATKLEKLRLLSRERARFNGEDVIMPDVYELTHPKILANVRDFIPLAEDARNRRNADVHARWSHFEDGSYLRMSTRNRGRVNLYHQKVTQADLEEDLHVIESAVNQAGRLWVSNPPLSDRPPI